MFRRYVMVSWYSRALIGPDSWEVMQHQIICDTPAPDTHFHYPLERQMPH
jgi:hypothetical protein